MSKVVNAIKPDLEGIAGKAWKIETKDNPARNPAVPEGLTVASWIVYAPHSHPIWPYVLIACISLRDVPGVPPATIRLPGATHEVFVYALNPDSYPPDMEGQLQIMRPVNYVGQFIADSDDTAVNRIWVAVNEVVDGTLNPDEDGRQQWVKRFGKSNIKA